MKSLRWFVSTIIITLFILVSVGAFVSYADPFFHYHAPLKGYSYRLEDSRYQNDGIVRNFAYDAMITGTSMSANFKASEYNEVFGVDSIKVPMFGASLKEIDDNLKRALEANKDLRVVIRPIDLDRLNYEKDFMQYSELPTYLYDKNPFNDVEYLFNKESAIKAGNVLKDTFEGKGSTSFDDYQYWQPLFNYGKEAVLAAYERPSAPSPSEVPFTPEDDERIRQNVMQNVTSTPLQYPDVTFYYYITPYSICYWDTEVNLPKRMDFQINMMKVLIEECLEVPNIRLYGFDDKYEIITDLDYFKDVQHYNADVNSMILKWMKDGEGLLDKNNYQAYLERLREFYSEYDYDSIYE